MNPKSLITLFSLALQAGWDLSAIKVKPDRESCAQCGKKIPPGKTGRKCPDCREEKRP